MLPARSAFVSNALSQYFVFCVKLASHKNMVIITVHPQHGSFITTRGCPCRGLRSLQSAHAAFDGTPD